MEISNLPVISKRVWSIVRVLFFMRPKGFTKPKLLMHLNLMLKLPGKLAGKAIANLISHHHHHHSHHGISAASHGASLQFCTAREYEFSCGNAPKYSFFSKRHIIPRHSPACAHAPLTLDDDAVEVNNALKLVSEMLEYDKKGKAVVEASPAVPASGRTRMVRQVRVTDSPFPVQDCVDGDHQVDKAAEEFINSFYMELMKQEIDGPEEGLRRYNPRHGEGGNGSCNGVGEKSREGSFFQLKKSHLGCYLGLNKCWIERGHSTMVVGESSTGRGCRRIVERSENEKKMVNKDDLRKCLEIRGME